MKYNLLNNPTTPSNLTGESNYLKSLADTYPRSTTGQLSYTSTTSGITYATTGSAYNNQGQQGLMLLIQDALTDYMLFAEDINDITDNISANQGFYLDKEYLYGANTGYAILPTNATFTSLLGTQSQDVTNYKINNESLKVLENDNTASNLSSKVDNLEINYTKFLDGSTFASTDYFYIVLYISDIAKVTSVYIEFGVDATFNESNTWYKNVFTSCATGWNFLKVAKSAFAKSGTASDWTSIQSLRLLWSSTINAQNAYVSWQLIQPVRKDPSSSAPNQFQRNINGTWTRDFAINTGEWYLGYENGKLICRDIGTDTVYVALTGQKAYSDFVATMATKIGTSQYSAHLAYYVDSNNFVICYVASDNLTLTKRISGSYTTVSSTSLSVVADDKLELCLTRNGNAFELIAIKNNNRSVLYSLPGSITIGTTGYLGVGSAISPAKYDNIENLSITTTAHAHHADIAEVAKVANSLSETARDTDATLSLNSDEIVPSQKAVKTYADTKIAKTLLSAKGDIPYASSANTPARLAIGNAYRILRVNSSADGLEYVGENALSSASDTIIASAATTQTKTNTMYLKAKSFRIGISGYYRIKYSFRGTYNGGHYVFADLRINTVSADEQNTLNSAWIDITYNTTQLEVGDIVDIYIKTENAAKDVEIKNAYLCGTITRYENSVELD